MHRIPFKTRAFNEFFLRAFAFFGRWDYVWFRPSHIRCHQATVHDDYAKEVVLPGTLALQDWYCWLGLPARNPRPTWDTLKHYARRATGYMDNEWYVFVLTASNATLRAEHRKWVRFALLGHVTLAAWFLVVLINGRFYCNWLNFLCGAPQHFGLSSNAPDFRLCCRTYISRGLPAFLYWNMQHHTEHHMFPAIPFFNLPKVTPCNRLRPSTGDRGPLEHLEGDVADSLQTARAIRLRSHLRIAEFCR